MSDIPLPDFYQSGRCYWGNPYADESSVNSLNAVAVSAVAATTAYSAEVATDAAIIAVFDPSVVGLDAAAVVDTAAYANNPTNHANDHSVDSDLSADDANSFLANESDANVDANTNTSNASTDKSSAEYSAADSDNTAAAASKSSDSIMDNQMTKGTIVPGTQVTIVLVPMFKICMT
jgi:hypothetical protein